MACPGKRLYQPYGYAPAPPNRVQGVTQGGLQRKLGLPNFNARSLPAGSEIPVPPLFSQSLFSGRPSFREKA